MRDFIPSAGLDYQQRLENFVRESNYIEGIVREPLPEEVRATHEFLRAEHVTIREISLLASRFQPGAVVRSRVGCNVTVGEHTPPPGGPGIPRALMALLFHSPGPEIAFWRHREYETLHPLTDGNGRTGRALWLRDMGGPVQAPLGFLHHWYYQSLAQHRVSQSYTWPST